MNIVHIIASIDPAKGGPQAVVVRLAAAQGALGHRVSVASYAEPREEARLAAAMTGIPGLGEVELRLVTGSGPRERLTADRAACAFGPLIAGADFLHVHGVWDPILVRATRIAMRSGTSYCVRSAGMLDPWSLGQKRWKKKLALLLSRRRMLDGAAFIHALNPDERRLMAPLRLRSPRVTIPNGVFLDEIEAQAVSGRFRATVPGLDGDPFVLFLSRLHTKKGLDILAEAFVRLARRRQSVRLVVAGPDEGAEVGLRAAVDAAGLADRTHIVGPLFGARKFEALADAACFCLPSRQEGFSVAIIEALACGVPVAISDACHFPEVAEVGAGYVLPLDASAFAQALDHLLAEPADAARMGRRGRRLVGERFTWPQIASRTLAAYAEFGRPGEAVGVREAAATIS